MPASIIQRFAVFACATDIGFSRFSIQNVNHDFENHHVEILFGAKDLVNGPEQIPHSRRVKFTLRILLQQFVYIDICFINDFQYSLNKFTYELVGLLRRELVKTITN
jgi:hypothetical protein